MVFRREIELGGRTLSVEVGKVAKQSDGAAWVQYGDTIVLAAVNSKKERSENTDFFPLTVDYREKKYGGGKVPGGFFKREARPHDKETLIARMTDRPLRPLFAKGYYHETQVLLNVYSHDQENEGDILGQMGAAIALLISDIPFQTPVATVRIGRIEDELVINPTIQQSEECDMLLLVAGTEDAIAMVEGEAKEVSEDAFLEAIDVAHNEIKRLIEFQKEFVKELGKPEREWEPVVTTEEVAAAVKELVGDRVNELITIADKTQRKTRQKEIKVEIREALAEKFPDQEKQIGWALEDIVKNAMRGKVIADRKRIDGREPHEIRPISVETGTLPRAHGSSLFTRGQTQALGSCTLGTKIDEQKIDGLEGEYWKTFMLHYNFPPFSTGEVKRMMGPGRRELGHGHLAESALKATLPDWDDFPYTIRIVSEVLESNGSSSMASVCAGSLALMDCGVPVKKSVAGIAMGLIKEGDEFVVLSDILGDEDALGDMDFKVAGTRDGITAFQMDIKIAGISKEIMAKALEQAKAGRYHILDIMDSVMPKHRDTISKYAPTIINTSIEPEYIGMIIGPGGKMIRALQTDYGVNIEIDDDGTVSISSTSREAAEAVLGIIKNMTREPEIGEEFDAKVVKIVDFGAFVELFPGKEGLVHVSELEWKRVDKVTDILNMGDTVRVKLVSKTPEGKLDLSRKALLPKPEGYVEREKRPPRPGGGGGGRGGSRGGGGNRGGGGGRRR
ncbi:polyribonucleotide nucleotidyltransferase [bacterium]|nr:polyribonucleotide nucleotidyltransferase [bacterium]